MSTPGPCPDRAILDRAALGRALAGARDRDPWGRRLRRFRWAVSDEALWLMPAALGGVQDLEAVTAVSPPLQRTPTREPVPWAFRLATATRQDLWRRLQATPGLMPVIQVAGHAGSAPHLLAHALVPAGRATPGLENALGALYRPDRLALWIAWASARPRRPARG